MKSGMWMAMAVMVAGIVFGQTFDPARGLREPEKVVVAGKTNLVAEANIRAFYSMTVQERAAQWPYLDKQLTTTNGPGLERMRAAFVQNMERKTSLGAGLLPGLCRPVCAVRILVSCGRVTPAEVAALKEVVKKHAVQQARLHLFAQGKTPVAKDGNNPLTAVMAPVIAGLNGPACAGLIDALAGIGITDLTDGGALPAFVPPDAKQIGELTEAARQAVVTTGESLAQGQLLLLLGVDGYNAFVRQFNEGL
jgi:hypothetical protein